MKKMRLCMILFSIIVLRAQGSGVREQLQNRLHLVEAERDAVQIRLLETEARTRPLVDQLTREQMRLSEELESTRKRMLHLESAGGVTDNALRRAEAELLEKSGRVEALEEQLRRESQAYEDHLERERGRAGELEREGEALEERMKATAAQLETLRAEEAQLRQEKDDISNLNRQLEEDVRQARRGESLANAQLAALISRLDLMQNQLETAYRDRSEALQEAERLTERVQGLQKELDDARASSTPNEAVERIQQALDLVQAENTFLKGELDRLRNQPDLREPLARAERDRDLLDAKLKTLETRLSETQAALSQEQSRRHELEQGARGLVERLERTEAERDVLFADMEELRGQREQERDAFQDEIRALREETESKGRRLGELIEVEQASVLLLEEREKLLERLLIKTGEVDSLVEEVNVERQRHTREIADLRGMLGASMHDYQLAQNRLRDLERGGARLTELEAERARIAMAETRARQDLRILANHIHSLRREVARREERENSFDAERRQLLERIRQLEGLPGNP